MQNGCAQNHGAQRGITRLWPHRNQSKESPWKACGGLAALCQERSANAAAKPRQPNELVRLSSSKPAQISPQHYQDCCGDVYEGILTWARAGNYVLSPASEAVDYLMRCGSHDAASFLTSGSDPRPKWAERCWMHRALASAAHSRPPPLLLTFLSVAAGMPRRWQSASRRLPSCWAASRRRL